MYNYHELFLMRSSYTMASFAPRRRGSWQSIVVIVIFLMTNSLTLFTFPRATSADIVDGENALDELGQNGNNLCTPTAVFSKVSVDDTPNAYGYNTGNNAYSAIDSVHHRLFV